MSVERKLLKYWHRQDEPSYNSIRSMNEAIAYYSARLGRLSTGEPPHIDLGPDPQGEARLRQLRAKCGVTKSV